MPSAATPRVNRGFILGSLAFLWGALLLVVSIEIGGWWAKHPGNGWATTVGYVESIDCRYRGKYTSRAIEWRYRYEVDGVQHVASYDYDFCDPDQLFVSRMRGLRGSTQVFYNPEDPSDSVLEKEPRFPWRHLSIKMLHLVVAIMFTWVGWKNLRAPA